MNSGPDRRFADVAQLADQRIIIYGDGSAGLGIARQLRDAIQLESACSETEAGSKFWLIDQHGLIKTSLGDKVRDEIEDEFRRKEQEWGHDENGLQEVVEKVKPTVLIGTSTQAGAFTEGIVSLVRADLCGRNIDESQLREMAKHVDRPIIFPVRAGESRTLGFR